MILAAMEDDQATRVVMRLQEFLDRLAKQQGKNKIPIRVFALPCERLI
jgi:hypothetical protein